MTIDPTIITTVQIDFICRLFFVHTGMVGKRVILAADFGVNLSVECWGEDAGGGELAERLVAGDGGGHSVAEVGGFVVG